MKFKERSRVEISWAAAAKLIRRDPPQWRERSLLTRRVVMAKVDEIAPDVFRISILEPQFNLQFNHFLIRDEEPLLFHAGYKRMFPELREAVTRLLNPESIRWVSFSHFESDECGALNHWLEISPKAQA